MVMLGPGDDGNAIAERKGIVSRMRAKNWVIGGLVAAFGIVFLVGNTLVTVRKDPETVRVAVLPDRDPDEVRRIYRPLLAYLTRETGLKFTLMVPKSYADLLDLFAAGRIDLAKFGGYTYVKANTYHGARPLVMRDIDARFTTLFVTRRDGRFSNCRGLDCKGLKEAVFSFGSRLSTSGHLMPRHFLKVQKKMVPETCFREVRYSGAHDKTVRQVQSGEADFGAVNFAIYEEMLRSGRLENGDVKIIWETPPYADYVWSVGAAMTEDLKTKLRDAFLRLDANNPDHAEILGNMNAGLFLPAGSNDFAALKDIAKSLDMLDAK